MLREEPGGPGGRAQGVPEVPSLQCFTRWFINDCLNAQLYTMLQHSTRGGGIYNLQYHEDLQLQTCRGSAPNSLGATG